MHSLRVPEPRDRRSDMAKEERREKESDPGEQLDDDDDGAPHLYLVMTASLILSLADSLPPSARARGEDRRQRKLEEDEQDLPRLRQRRRTVVCETKRGSVSTAATRERGEERDATHTARTVRPGGPASSRWSRAAGR